MVNDNVVAVVFPGQGSQARGMLSAYAGVAAVADAVAEVSEVLAVDFATLIEHDADALNQTVNTQPAMLALGVGVYRAAQPALPPPLCFAGHSLGEYSALVCAGALSLAAAAQLVRQRAELMQSAVSDGSMAAVLGLEAAAVAAVCQDLRRQDFPVWPANYNSPLQTVIAGRKAAVAQAADALRTAGAKRVVILPMSTLSHCPLLQPAADALAESLSHIAWSPPQPPVLHNAAFANAEAGNDAVADIPALLAAQLVCPVRWTAVLDSMKASGVCRVVECGPGKVLTALGKGSGLAHTALADAAALADLTGAA